jgi:succinate dehydrogenase / fumarate reductase iron-sulfur subunit
VTRSVKNLTLKVWRQSGPDDKGRFETHVIESITDEASFLEMLDVLNERLIDENKEAIVFDHDCREGICGTCSLMINGQAHGPQRATTTCQLHLRSFNDNDTIVIEPWRASAFPIIKDLMVDRAAFDRIVESGGFITSPTGGAPDANLIPVPKPTCLSVQKLRTSICCLRVKPSDTSVPKRWSTRWTNTLVRAPTMANVRQPARKRFRWMSLR